MASLDQTLRTWYESRAPRERILVNVAAAFIVVALVYVLLLAPLSKATANRSARVERKQSDLAWIRSMIGPLQQLEATRPRINMNESLLVIIDRSARQVGLTLAGQSPNGENSMRVRLENAQFDLVVTWLGQLNQQYGLEIDSAQFDKTGKIGVVNGSLNLTRAAQ
jgi:general secretion pathway protein M